MNDPLEPRKFVDAYGKVALFSLVYVVGAQLSLFNVLSSFGIPFYHIYVRYGKVCLVSATMMSWVQVWVDCLLTDSEVFILFAENSQILLKNSVTLKLGQNKKGQKIFYLHRFLNPFLQLAAEKKDSKNGAARTFFGPSYFVTALL